MSQKPPSISVIFTTYNQPEWLYKVLIGFSCQTFRSFEIIIADDGSTEETKQIINKASQWINVPLIHIWHEDRGYQKCSILNKAIKASHSDYLVFTDGDCIPRSDFLATHYSNRSTKHFLSGGAVRLPIGISQALTSNDIISNRCFDTDFLNQLVEGEQVCSKKLTRHKWYASIMNSLTTARASWNGGNASCYKAHILAVNGMDERMQYGGEDRQLGERLQNLGLKGKQLRYKAITLHLEHARGYISEEGWKFNNALRKTIRRDKISWTPYGIIKTEEAPLDIIKKSQELYRLKETSSK